MSGQLNAEIEDCVRKNITWQYLPVHLKQVKQNENNNNRRDYDKRVGRGWQTIHKLRHIPGMYFQIISAS